ncbi:MAG TPA: PHP domain-containing protein [Candidatus Hydrogenedentes bacterium]|nr:PHP domain-containing protein [Candidatus Hydrogenedentota bacterium]HPG67374.1 PHP domain-containing protein [Candidatus Hydrogenedentota bacterium]
MPCPKYDFHMHTAHIGCANQTMIVADIVETCTRVGCSAIGISDHLNSLDQLPTHERIKADLEAVVPGIDVYFGVELNFVGCDQGFAFNTDIKEEYGFQFAVGGIHDVYTTEYDLAKIIEIQHRHHLRTCEDPLVDVLVHPYWFSRQPFNENHWPWFDSVSVVPDAYARELGQVARDTGTAVEINAMANVASVSFSEPYIEAYVRYLSIIAAEGPMFSVGSDAHDIGQLPNVADAWKVAERLGLDETRIWRPAQTAFRRPTASGGSL